MSSGPAFPGVRPPAAGFDQPFEMLASCHDRVRRSLDLLQRLVQHVSAHGVDEQAQDAARDVLRYFRMAAPAHHEDEERHVIPLLEHSGDPHAQAMARRMLDDHARIRAAWDRLQPLLAAVAEDGAAQFPALADEAGAFVALHGGHLALEDACALPDAQRRMGQRGAAALAAMGREMARRRGAPDPG